MYHGRFKQGHIIADGEYPSVSASVSSLPAYGQQQQQQQTAIGSDDATPDTPGSRYDGARPGGADDGASSDDDDNFLANPEVETTVTLIGSVRGRPVLIMDDMIDKPDSWIAAAETVVKRAGATEVYCLATHGLFGGDCLAELESCESINAVVVTNTFPVPTDKIESTSKLHVVDISSVVSEAIRRNHHGESLAQLYLHLDQVSL